MIKPDATVSCWGSNSRGQLGQPVDVAKPVWPATNVNGLLQVVSIAAGHEHTCALLSQGTVTCWGQNDRGQLGDGTRTARAMPVAVPKLAKVVSLAAGADNTCAVRSDGTVWCWGDNTNAQAGSARGADVLVPTRVKGVKRAVTVKTHYNNACATLSDGSLTCWGSNTHEQLGHTVEVRPKTPVPVAFDRKINELGLGYDFVCALDELGDVTCWGWNHASQTGMATADLMFDASQAIRLTTKIPYVRLASSRTHTCATRSDGAVLCWGQNSFGASGNAPGGDVSVVTGLGQISEIAVGGDHSCALSETGSVQCWGANLQGQLGAASSVKSLVPVRAL